MKKTMIASIVLIAIAVIAVVGYNIYRRPATFRHLTNKSLDEQQVNELKNSLLEKDDKKIFVAYFSYSGTTKNVATALSGKTDYSVLYQW